MTSPAKPKPLDSSAKEKAVKKYENENETYMEWTQANTEAKHYIFSMILDSLLVKTINCVTSVDLWKAICTEHKGKTKITGDKGWCPGLEHCKYITRKWTKYPANTHQYIPSSFRIFQANFLAVFQVM